MYFGCMGTKDFISQFLGGSRVLFAVLALAGCSTLPTTGPYGVDVKSEQPATPESLPYSLVTVTPDVVSVLADSTGPYLDRLCRALSAPGNPIWGG